MMLRLIIAGATPSLNVLANRRSRFAYTIQRRRWHVRIGEAWALAKYEQGQRWVTPPQCRVRVTVERFGRTANALDRDNLLGGLKPVLDALRRHQLIDDDTHGALELVTEQPKTEGGAMWTRITLERLDGALL